LSSDLGLSRVDRGEQARRVAHVAATLAESGVIPIVALVSPYAEECDRAREIHEANGLGFLEVWVDTPLEVCETRDVKGLYASARAADISATEGPAIDGSGLTGLTSPYEAPTNPDLRVDGEQLAARDLAGRIVDKILAYSAHSWVFLPDGG
jgi:bifunctional enzyme CysN/CysC